jgi:hypothetical protein
MQASRSDAKARELGKGVQSEYARSGPSSTHGVAELRANAILWFDFERLFAMYENDVDAYTWRRLRDHAVEAGQKLNGCSPQVQSSGVSACHTLHRRFTHVASPVAFELDCHYPASLEGEGRGGHDPSRIRAVDFGCGASRGGSVRSSLREPERIPVLGRSSRSRRRERRRVPHAAR